MNVIYLIFFSAQYFIFTYGRAFDYWMIADNYFRFPVDSFELYPLAFEYKIVESNCQCLISDFSFILPQSTEYKFDLLQSFSKIHASEEYLYLINNSDDPYLYVYQAKKDEALQKISHFSLINAPLPLPLSLSTISIERSQPYLIILDNFKIHIFKEEINGNTYNLNLLSSFSLNSSYSSSFLLAADSDNPYLILTPTPKMISLSNITKNEPIFIDVPPPLNSSIKATAQCMNIYFFLNGEGAIFFSRNLTQNMKIQKFWLGKAVEDFFGKVEFFKIWGRNLIISNSSFWGEIIFLKDCLDIRMEGNNSVERVYYMKNLGFDGQMIEEIAVDNFVLTLILSNGDVIYKRLGNFSHTNNYFIIRKAAASASLAYPSFLDLTEGKFPFILSHDENNNKLKFQILGWQRSELLCGPLIYGETQNYVGVEGRGDFCNYEMYNYTAYNLSNTSKSLQEDFFYDPGSECIRRNNFYLLEKKISEKVMIPILVIGVIVGSVIFVFVAWITWGSYKRWKKERGRRKMQFREVKPNIVSMEEIWQAVSYGEEGALREERAEKNEGGIKICRRKESMGVRLNQREQSFETITTRLGRENVGEEDEPKRFVIN